MAEEAFFYLTRKGAFIPILQILADHPAGMTSADFFVALKQIDLYFNAYIRLREKLLDAGLIDFRINADKDKVMYLTPNGIDFLETIHKAQLLLKGVQNK